MSATPGEPRRRTIDDSFAELLAGLPREMQDEGRDLPHRLGLTGPSGGWEDFIVMDPNRDLPRYAAEDPERPGRERLSPYSLDLYRRAHHSAGVFGLIADRLADGQVRPRPRLVHLRDHVLRSWTNTLAAATASPPRARALVGLSLRDLRRGNRRERAALSRARKLGEGSLAVRDYVTFTCEKLRWFGTGAHALLLTLGEPRRATLLRRAYDLFSVALQLIDDALDEPRDRAQRKMSFPGALGLPPGAMLAASPVVAARASRVARQARFHELADWLAHFARTIDRRPVPGHPQKNALAAAALLSAVEEVLHG